MGGGGTDAVVFPASGWDERPFDRRSRWGLVGCGAVGAVTCGQFLNGRTTPQDVLCVFEDVVELVAGLHGFDCGHGVKKNLEAR